MTDPSPEAFIVATEKYIADFVACARLRLVVVTPAVSALVGDAVCRVIESLPPEAVTLIFNSDPEVYRLGTVTWRPWSGSS